MPSDIGGVIIGGAAGLATAGTLQAMGGLRRNGIETCGTPAGDWRWAPAARHDRLALSF
ncbi:MULTISPECIES: hypothetical protein [Mesorhizobium]|uniref:hypothetical protein n=1 Tax=Mesorhizobium TaxID=68287 RepID=UPI0013153EE9|nr:MULTISPECIES: hypothetical protein [Mesorhizobium]